MVTPAVGLAVTTTAVALATWSWQASVFRTHPTEVTEEAWGEVKDAYPLPQDAVPRAPFSAEMADAVVRANPFSPQRRFVPPPPSQGGAGGAPEPIASPRFIYKGQISVGGRQRAIVENTTAQKTHFLEVGQEVAGFKVLDITQNRVVLSDLQTHKDVVVPLVSTAGAEADKSAREAASEP
jgi:hypothetical protein